MLVGVFSEHSVFNSVANSCIHALQLQQIWSAEIRIHYIKALLESYDDHFDQLCNKNRPPYAFITSYLLPSLLTMYYVIVGMIC